MSAIRPPVVSRPVFPLTNKFPTTTRCLLVDVPDDPYYLSLFYGQVQALGYWYNYDRDAAHTGARIAALWKKCVLGIRQCPPPPPPIIGGGFQVGEDMQIKQDPANPCLVREVCPDGSLGCVVIDLSLCKPNFTPGGGSTPPSGGACAAYNLSIQANAVTLLPFVVNTGDTLLLSSVNGASSDASLHWFCPDGSFFILGACAGGGYTSGSDPLPTTRHNALLWRIGSNFYPVTTALFTVPAGVANQPIYLQVNNPSVSSVAGGFNIAFNFCNNQAVTSTWCHTYDFTIAPYAFASDSATDGNGQTITAAVWVAAAGWEANPQQPPPATTQECVMFVRFDMGAVATVTQVEVIGAFGTGTGGTFELALQGDVSDPTFVTGAFNFFNDNTPTRGASFHYNPSISPTSARYLKIYSNDFSFLGGSTPILTVSKIIVHGTGTNPFGSSNC